MSKQMNIRLDEVHQALLEKVVEKIRELGGKTNKTDVIQKGIYTLSKELLDDETITKIIDDNYTGIYKWEL